MKIVFITTGLGMGGAEKQLCSLADEYVEKGHFVHIISLTDTLIIKPQKSEVKIDCLNLKKSFVSFINAYCLARKIIKRIRPDVVHSHMIHANIFARLLRISTPIKFLVSTMHNKNEGGKLRMLSYRLTDFLTDLSTNVSQEAVDVFLEKKAVTPNKVRVQYNGIDTKKFKFSQNSRVTIRDELNIADNDIVFLSVGRLTKAKDYPNLLVAFSHIKATYSNIKILIIGDGELKGELQYLTKKLNLENNVLFLGLKNNVYDWMSACDFFVLSSEWEGFGLVVAEAMSCERITIATDSGGVKEVLGNNGFLVPIKDSGQLSAAVLKAISMPDIDKENLKRLARKHIEDNFSIEKIVSNWIEIYSNEKK
ncbi:glycosyltransferase [Providencia sp. JGM181]|uniref:glycosyltransferase n=1 Tax=unclassified Providencia TaxID=2633465 RepID=UPI001BACC8D1|nr:MULTISPECIES: glycosyltransferase [unclassified Providencia]MBS0926210.1 glycosyltransferase [Providencia sp. JGM181]MBS0934658.1 glycosyltransferase [Providencia sp. JGM172]MBS0998398.1 glycosyltransferase [Providencia sp. JGM178]